MVSRRLHAPEAQSVTFVELFFDLVFVFAVTQVTKLTVSDLTWAGVGRSVLVFWLIWWAWTQFTWTLSPADTNHTAVRALTLVASAVAFMMASTVTRAYGDDALWFAIPYVLVRLLGLALQLRLDLERTDEHRGAISSWIVTSLAGLVFVLVGAAVDTPARYWLWGVAILLDVLAAARGGTRHDWDLVPAHFSERHGLFVIIALGESLIVAATVVSDEELTTTLVAVVIAALVAACLLWWTYFGWLKEALEHGLARASSLALGPMARDAYSLGHFPLVCGIIGFAVAVEEVVHHPSDAPDRAVTIALAAGIALFVGASALAMWRATRRVLLPRLAVLVVTVMVLVALRSWEPVWQLAVVVLGLSVIVVVEGSGPAGDASDDSVPLAD